MSVVRFPKPDVFDKKLEHIKKEGVEKLHIVSDFDRTLTKGKVEGEGLNSSFARLRHGVYLPPEYTQKATELYNEYYQYELDRTIPIEVRSEKMREWWVKSLDQLIEYGLNKKVFTDAVKDPGVHAREDLPDLLKLASDKQIPFLIFSAGLGDYIKEYLTNENLLTENIRIVSNLFKFDEEGKAIGVADLIIHPFNKHVIEVAETEYGQHVLSRKNVILLGDALGDASMADGFDHETILKIGFLNDREEQYGIFKEHFDVIIQEDKGLDFVINLIKEI